MIDARAAVLILAKIFIFLLQGVCLSSAAAVIFLAVSAVLYSLKIKKTGARAGSINVPFSIVIPAYAEGEVLLDCVAALERQNYPRDRVKISIVADKVDPALIARLRKRGVVVYTVDFEVSTKIRALKYFIEHNAPRAGEYVVVLDADNVCHPDFLKEIGKEINRGFRVIQGKRVAKNLDTIVARLDAISEYNNNFVFRRSTLLLNTSCPITGSGFAIEYGLFSARLQELPSDIMGGYDRVLQVNLVLYGGEESRIKYCEEAVCYDEKTRRGGFFLKQRARWLAAYLQYAGKSVILLEKALSGSNKVAFFMALSIGLPPYSWICGLTFLLFLAAVVFGAVFLPAPLYLGLFIILWAIPLFALYAEKVGKRVWVTCLLGAPLFVLLFVRAMFQLKSACGQFLHTPHGAPPREERVCARGILHIIRQLEYGGGEQYVKNLVLGLDREKYIPYVIGYRGGTVFRQLRELGVACEIINLNPMALPRIIRYIRKKKISIVHGHGTKGALLGSLAARAAGVPFIYTEHGWSFHAKQLFLRHKLAVMAENVICLLADRVICVAETEVSGIKALVGVDPGKVRLIENGIDTNVFDPGRSRNESGSVKACDKLVMAMIGRVTIQKDPGCFLAVAKMFKNDPRFEFWMVGDGDLLEKIRSGKAAAGLDNLLFYPPTDDTAGFLNKIDCLVMPSFWEAAPLILLEAMAMRKICIAADVGLARKVIEDGETGFLVHRLSGVPLAEQIAVKIREMAAAPGLRERMGNKAHDIIVKNYRLEGVLEKMKKVYEELV